MIRLMCSSDRQGLEVLGGKLSRSGILSEIRGNPLTAVLGIPRFELFVHEGDLPVASRLCQGHTTVDVEVEAPGDARNARGFNGFVEPEQSDLLIEAKVLPSSPSSKSRNPERVERSAESGGEEPQTELAQATALLEEEVEALLAREGKLIDRCAALEEKLKAAEQALAQTRTDLTREKSNRTEAEKKLTEAGEKRASLEKDLHAMELRIKESERALATAQARLDSQAQQQELLAKEQREQEEQVQVYLGTVNELRNRVRARLAAKENEGPASPERHARRSSAEN